MRVIYVCKCKKDSEVYYKNQVGCGLSYFTGFKRQKGYGIFSNILRLAIPFVQSGLLELSKLALKTGDNIVSDVESGKSLSGAFKQRSEEIKSELKNKILNKLSRLQQGGA